METLSYWLARLEPLIRAEADGEIIVVLANRCGTEEEAVYAGTSAVLGICDGEVRVYGILGRGEKELLVVDTSSRPQAKLISEPNSAASTATASTTQSNNTDAWTSTGLTSPDMDDAFPEFENNFSPVSPRDPKDAPIYFNSNDMRDEDENENPTQLLQSSNTDSRIPVESPTSRLPITSPSRNPPTINSPQKSTNTGRFPVEQDQALTPHDLAHELEVNTSFPIRSPPVSASALPGSHRTSDPFEPRSRHISPRPRSSIW